MLIHLLAKPLRWIGRHGLLLLLILVLLAWLFGGRVLLTPDETVEARLERQVQQLKQMSPEAAAELAHLRETRGVRATLPAVELHDDLSSLRAWVNEASGRSPYEVELVQLADEAGLMRDDDDLEAFLYTHAMTCQLLTGAGGQAVEHYLDLLRQAHANPEAWRVVRDDPVALLLWPHLATDRDLWRFYERERDWLAEVIAPLAPAHEYIDEDEPFASQVDRDVQAEDVFVEAIRVAYRHHPLPRQAVVDEKLGHYGFSLFLAYGPLIERAVSHYNVPLDEMLEVLFTNADAIPPLHEMDPAEQTRSADRHARELAYLHRNKPMVWLNARHYPLVLRLNRDVPQYAEAILENYGADGITGLLYQYEDVLPHAARAVDVFGDVAVYYLALYAQDDRDRMVEALRHRDVGFRAIPFLARFGDEGFDRIENDPRWVDRYFDENGEARDPGWWMAVPVVGAPATVVINWTRGHPNEWGELGWAAFDVGSGVLLVASFGTSGVVTQSGRQVVRTTAQQTVRHSARRTATQSGRGAREAARQAMRRGTRPAPLRALGTRVAQVAQPATSAYLMTKRIAVAPVRGGWQAGTRMKSAWANLSPTTRLWTYRSLLATNMFITLQHRTIPTLREIGAERIGQMAGDLVGELVSGTFTAIGSMLAEAMRQVLLPQGAGMPWRWTLYFTVTLVLIALLGIVIRSSKRKQLYGPAPTVATGGAA